MFNLKQSILAFLKENNITPNRFSLEVRMSPSLIYTWLRGNRKIREDHYERILNWYLEQKKSCVEKDG